MRCQIHLQGSLLKFIYNAVRKEPWIWWFEYKWHEPNSIQLAFGDPCDFTITSISHLGEGKKNLSIAWNHQPARWRKSPRSLPRRRACNTGALEEATACSVSLIHSFPSLISLSIEDLCDLSLCLCLSVSVVCVCICRACNHIASIHSTRLLGILWKLKTSLQCDREFDLPPQTLRCYQREKTLNTAAWTRCKAPDPPREKSHMKGSEESQSSNTLLLTSSSRAQKQNKRGKKKAFFDGERESTTDRNLFSLSDIKTPLLWR